MDISEAILRFFFIWIRSDSVFLPGTVFKILWIWIRIRFQYPDLRIRILGTKLYRKYSKSYLLE